MNKKDSLRVVFMGTPDFAVESLKVLDQAGIHIVAVITATDKYGGRGRKQLIESAVKKYAVKNDIPVLQPKNLKAASFIEELESYEADLQVVVAFRMLPRMVWDMPPMGTINLHASYLPYYRGAAPINWAIINGEKETGVTIFKLKHEIDTGDLISRTKVTIDENETAGSLHDKLMHKGAKQLLDAVLQIQEGNVELSEQDMTGTYPKAPKIFHKDTRIDFSWDIHTIDHFIRGMCPYPTAHFSIDNQIIKVYQATFKKGETNKPGTIKVEDLQLQIACKDGWMIPIEVKPEGKRKMKTKDWLNGIQLHANRVDPIEQ